jgi:hypothetical protein
MKLEGVYPILATCFDSNGAIDYASQKRLIEFCIDAGVHGLVTLANASEGHLLSEAEKQELVAFIVKQVDGPALRVFAFRGLLLSGNLRFTGSRAPVIVVYGDVAISGSVDVGAIDTTPGPGGQSSCVQVATSRRRVSRSRGLRARGRGRFRVGDDGRTAP